MKILYLHGWNSGVGGVKPTYLKSHGYDVHEPALDHDDFQAALDTGPSSLLDGHLPLQGRRCGLLGLAVTISPPSAAA